MMTFKLSRLLMVGLFGVGALGVGPGCASDAPSDPTQEVDEEAFSSDDIVKIDNTAVKRQSIGNCWLYATASWVEALQKAQTGTDLNVSESYWTYWHWFEQIVGGWSDEISTGGSIGTATSIILRYGYMPEGTFLPAEAESESSPTQKTALDAINKSLKEGELKDRSVRTNREKARAALDKAFGLSAASIASIDKVFGKGVTRTLDRAFRTKKPGNGILRARDLQVKVPSPTTKLLVSTNLQEAIGTGSEWFRTGPLAWQEVNYPSSAGERRKFLQRVQNALHAGAPVVISWHVDFNALTSDSRFAKEQLDTRGPGRQGGHMTLVTDYQAKLADGTLLKQGVVATPEQLKAALKDDTKIEFLYVKNSWGAIRPDRWSTPAGPQAVPGYHALMMNYLDGPVKKCAEVNGTSDPNNCSPTTPLWDAYLPAGF